MFKLPRCELHGCRQFGAVILAGLLIFVVSVGAVGRPTEGQTIDAIRLMSGPIKMSFYDKGSPVGQQTFSADSPEAKLVGRWLSEHPHGWTVNWNDYAPRRILNGDRFHLNFHDGHVILNYEVEAGSHRWAQLSREIAPRDVPDVFGALSVNTQEKAHEKNKGLKTRNGKKAGGKNSKGTRKAGTGHKPIIDNERQKGIRNGSETI